MTKSCYNDCKAGTVAVDISVFDVEYCGLWYQQPESGLCNADFESAVGYPITSYPIAFSFLLLITSRIRTISSLSVTKTTMLLFVELSL